MTTYQALMLSLLANVVLVFIIARFHAYATQLGESNQKLRDVLRRHSRKGDAS